MGAREQVERLLKDFGAVLKRQHKHEVWQLPNGKTFVRSKTPSDRRAGVEDLHELQKALGIEKPKGSGVRREKKPKTKRVEKIKYERSGSLADGLRLSGVVEAELRERLERLEQFNNFLQSRIANLEARVELAEQIADLKCRTLTLTSH